MNGRIALIDMDGTLFDHDASVLRDLLPMCSPEEIEKHNIGPHTDIRALSDSNPYFEHRIDTIRKQAGWWRGLPKFQLGWDVLQIAQEHFCCQILTKGPRSKPYAWTEKVQCIQDHFGDKMSIDIVGRSKGGTYGRVLVDDFPDYIEKWLEHRPRGLVIMPAHEYNAYFKHDNVIRYDGTNLGQVEKALKAAAERESKQHWLDLVIERCPECNCPKSEPKRLVEANWSGRLNHYCQNPFHEGIR